MKSDAIAAVGIALVNLPLTVKPHLLFRKRRAEMEGRAGATLTSLAIAPINPIRFTRAITRSEPQWHFPIRSIGSPPQVGVAVLWPISSAAVEPRRAEGGLYECIRKARLKRTL